MRQVISKMLKKELSALMRKARVSRKLTQERMSELLDMDPRSYQDLESGRNLCGTVTLLLFTLAFPEADLERIYDLIRELFNGDFDDID